MITPAPSTEPVIEPSPPTTIIAFCSTIWNRSKPSGATKLSIAGVEPARHSRVETADAECQRLVAQQIDAQRLGRHLAIAHGDESARPTRDATRFFANRNSADRQDEAEVVEAERLVDRQRRERQGRRLEASGAEGDALPMQEHPLGGLREGQRGQRQVEAAEAQRRQRYGETDRRRDQGAGGKRQPERPAQPTCSRPVA